MSQIQRPWTRLAPLAVGLAIGAVLSAAVPPPAEGAPQPNAKELLAEVQEALDALSQKVEQIPTNWLPPPAEGRFQLVLPQAGPRGPVYEGVLDRRTGLVWQRAPSGTAVWSRYAQREALKCQTGGTLGWRLPFADELLSLAQVTRDGTFVLDADFPLMGELPPANTPILTQTEYFRADLRNVDYFSFVDSSTCGVIFTSAGSDVVFTSFGSYGTLWLVMGPGGAHR